MKDTAVWTRVLGKGMQRNSQIGNVLKTEKVALVGALPGVGRPSEGLTLEIIISGDHPDHSVAGSLWW